MLKAIVKTEKTYEVYIDQCYDPEVFDISEDWENICSSLRSKGNRLTLEDINMVRHATKKEDI